MRERINQAEKEQKKRNSREYDPYQTKFHLMPPVGWLNDPNGLCMFNGMYHVFFQYSPFNPNGGIKCWGHYVSGDFVNWDYKGAAILPDCEWDKNGAYSGSAMIDGGVMHIFYTGNVKEEGDFDYVNEGRQANTIYVTSRDGENFSPKMLVMTNKDYPADYTCHVRDPKVWKENGKYYMVQGGRKKCDKGAVLLFESDDLVEWHFVNEVTTDEKFGYMWECPDYFETGNTKILSFSPQGLVRQEFRHQNVYQSGFCIVSGSITKKCELGDFQEWDMGFDFYAPQTFETEDGRRILLGWAGIPDADYKNATVDYGWNHCLTIPREVVVENGTVMTRPISELESIRTREVRMGEINQDMPCYEIIVDEINDSGENKFELSFAKGVDLIYSDKIMTLRLNEDAGLGRTVRKLRLDRLNKIHAFVDSSIVEIFVNGGEHAFTSRFYNTDRKPEIKSAGSNIIVKLWRLL